MKKILLVLCCMTLVSLPMMALAVETEPEITAEQTEKTQKPVKQNGSKQDEAQKATQQEFKAALDTSRKLLKETQAKVKSVSEENKTLSKQVQTTLNAIKDGSKTVSSETLEKVKELTDKVKQLRTTNEETKGQIKEIMVGARASQSDKDFAAAKAAVNNAVSIMEARLGIKQQLNSVLKELVALLG